MERAERIEAITEALRCEPYNLLKNDCITKSRRLKKECQRLGVSARVVLCLGLGEARAFGKWRTIPVIHAWAEVEGRRVETSRRIGTAGVWGIVPVHIRPVIVIKL